jgi:regulator of cell morphogenesis and NO signaling
MSALNSAFVQEITVGQLVAERPARARVFEKHGIDYCCGGKTPLQKACARKKLDPGVILEELRACDEASRDEAQTDWTQATATELADDIVSTHHDFLREELPRLSFLVGKVARVHGEAHPELPLVQQLFEGVKSEMDEHMAKEERVLFPYCKALETDGAVLESPFGTVGNPIRVMEAEHAAVGAALDRIRELTRNYDPPFGGCNSYRAMLDGLKTLEQDMHLHVHKENNVLFPRALALEAKRRKTAA